MSKYYIVDYIKYAVFFMYDDFAILEPNNFDKAIKEYQKFGRSSVLSTKAMQPESQKINDKINYLLGLVTKLKQHTTNQDKIFVLDEIYKVVEEQQSAFNTLMVEGLLLAEEEPVTQIFCNNLKLAIQTTAEIVKLMIELKDNDLVAGEIKPQVTDIILQFLDVNNRLVSLFGECRYRGFAQRR